jgi:hypothetical protein
MIASNKERISDYELIAPDGNIAELEVKAYRAETWKRHIAAYESQTPIPGERVNYVARLIEQIQAGTARGHQMYIAISDGISPASRFKLLKILRPYDIRSQQIVYMPELAILKSAKALREHMNIPQPGTSSMKRGGGNEP